jgi:hypothetical protein
MTVIRGIVLGIGVLMLASACTNAPTPCSAGKLQGYCAPATANPSTALIGIGIICGTILLLVLALVVAHISTSWRHAGESDK